jgi:alkylated DNA repair dioxygenase AlkB
MATGRTELRDGGWLLYTEGFLAGPEADDLLKRLQTEVEWRQERIYGRPVPRLNAWFADPGVQYAYSGLRFQGSGWPEWLLDARHQVEAAAGTQFNSLLLNRYRDGHDSIGLHADAEPELGPDPVIATLSLGAARDFVLRHRRDRDAKRYRLTHGSLLIMGGTSQHFWLHGVPKTQTPAGERVSLTYRAIRETSSC